MVSIFALDSIFSFYIEQHSSTIQDVASSTRAPSTPYSCVCRSHSGFLGYSPDTPQIVYYVAWSVFGFAMPTTRTSTRSWTHFSLNTPVHGLCAALYLSINGSYPLFSIPEPNGPISRGRLPSRNNAFLVYNTRPYCFSTIYLQYKFDYFQLFIVPRTAIDRIESIVWRQGRGIGGH